MDRQGHDANWSTVGNWQSGVAPVANDDLEFPASAAQLANIDDLGPLGFSSLTLSGSGYSISASNSSTASFGTIDSSQLTGSNTVNLPITLSAATAVTVDAAAASLVLSGVISGSSSLTKSGLGTLDLTATNPYTGPTTISAGTLLVDGNQSSSAVTADTGTTLGGIGTVASIAATGATVSPGDSAPGILIDAGNATLGPDATPTNSTFDVVLDGTARGNGTGKYSQLQAGGIIDLSGVALMPPSAPIS